MPIDEKTVMMTMALHGALHAILTKVTACEVLLVGPVSALSQSIGLWRKERDGAPSQPAMVDYAVVYEHAAHVYRLLAGAIDAFKTHPDLVELIKED